MKEKNGQVWVETVLYTVIGLGLIALVLGFVMPKIQITKDKLLVEQSIYLMQSFDEKIQEVESQGDGNSRTFEFTMKKGELHIKPSTKEIRLILEGLKEPYSEPDYPIPYKKVMVVSAKGQKTSSANLTLKYENFILKYDDNILTEKVFSSAQTPYHFSITNNKNDINIIEVSKG